MLVISSAKNVSMNMAIAIGGGLGIAFLTGLNHLAKTEYVNGLFVNYGYTGD